MTQNIKAVLGTIFLLIAACSLSAEEIAVSSPNGQVLGKVTIGETVSLDLDFDSCAVLRDTTLGLELEEGGFGLSEIESVETRSIDTEWENRFGRNKIVKDQTAETTILLTEKESPNRKWGLVFRAFDNGFAFRYLLRQGGKNTSSDFTLREEKTIFRFPADFDCWWTNNKKYNTSNENPYILAHLSEIPKEAVVGLPLTAVGDFGYAALTEAACFRWPVMHLLAGDDPQTLKIGFAPRPDNGKTAVGTYPFETPWRVILFGKTAVDLVNGSDALLNLNPPCAIEETGWIKPGTSGWDWWTHNNSDLSTENFKQKVDFSAEMGWPYTTLDASWHGVHCLKAKEGDVIDILSGCEKFNFEEGIKYAHEKGIGVFLWLHQKDLRACGVEKAFAFYEKWGIAGLKIDFFDAEDQDTVEWAETILRCGAEHHLMINLHGIYPPSGIYRTWPNFLTQEGILGNENSKWSTRADARHGVTLPFTRYLIGPGDYTPGGFINRHREDFQPQKSPKGFPQQIGTRAYALAQCVLYNSPLMTICDDPDHYRNDPSAEMLKNLPSVWDESRAIAGEIGEFFVMARKSGEKWYLSAMTNEEARSIEVTLDFLPEGTVWNGDLYTDAPESETNAEAIAISRRTFKAGETVTIKMAREGGWNLILTPAK